MKMFNLADVPLNLRVHQKVPLVHVIVSSVSLPMNSKVPQVLSEVLVIGISAVSNL